MQVIYERRMSIWVLERAESKEAKAGEAQKRGETKGDEGRAESNAKLISGVQCGDQASSAGHEAAEEDNAMGR